MARRLATLGLGLSMLATAACSGAGDAPSATDGGGGAASTSSSSGPSSGPDATTGTSTTASGLGASTPTSSGSGASSAGGGGGGGGSTMPAAHLTLPPYVALPYVLAGAGGSTADVTLTNDGDAAATGLVWSLTGDAALTLGSAAPTSIGAHATMTVTITFAGAAAEAVSGAALAVTSSADPASSKVYAVAGDPGLGAATWSDVVGVSGVLCGTTATVAMPAAPYPDGSGAFTDPSVNVFVPADYRERGAEDMIVHFHGFSTTIDATLAAHLYREQVYYSGVDAVLVVPQGPVNTASGDFGKLMKPGGLTALTREVLVLLFREGKILAPVLDELVLTSHSGGYNAVAVNLRASAAAPKVGQVNLFDSLYGDVSTYEAFVTSGGVFRSNYTAGGGTDVDNEDFVTTLMGDGIAVDTEPTLPSLRDTQAVIFFSDSSHDDSTRIYASYAEELRWGMRHGRRGPRIDLRAVEVSGSSAHVRWLAPHDDDLTGFDVETSPDGVTWTHAASAAADATDATFALPTGARVRVLPRVPGVADPQPSDVYRVDPGATTLVVDGFDRVLDGAFGGMTHDFAAQVGEATGRPVATIARRALLEDAFDPSRYATLVWVLGDQSTMDVTLAPGDQTILSQFVASGGHLIMTGSELGYDLSSDAGGAAFLQSSFGAVYSADASNSYTVASAPALGASLSFTYGGAAAAYHVNYPDVYAASAGAALDYGNALVAAVGKPGKSVVVGFPLETIDARADLRAATRALLTFAGAP